MDLTPEDYDAMLAHLRGGQTAPVDTAAHGFTRLAANIANIPGKTAEGVADAWQGLSNTITGKPQEVRDFEAQGNRLYEQKYSPFHIPTIETGAPKGFTDVASDVVPEVAMMASGAGALGGISRLARIGPRIANVVGDVGIGALSGIRDSGKESAMQAGEFGLMGAAGALLPRGVRPLFRRATEGAVGAGVNLAGQAMRGNDLFSPQSLQQSAIMGLTPLAMEAAGGARRLFRRGAEAPSTAPTSDGIPTTWKLKRRTETADGRYEHTFDTPEGEQIITHAEPLGGDLENRIVPREADPSMGGRTVGNPYGPETVPRPRRALPESAEPRPPDDSIIEGEFSVEPPKQLMGRRLFLNGPPPYGQGGGDRRFRMQGDPYEPPAGPIPMGRSEPRRLLNRAEPDIHSIAADEGVKYDGPIEFGGTKLHQFTDISPRASRGATFTLKGDVTPEALRAKREAKTMQFAAGAKPSGLRPLSREGGSIDPALLGGIAGATVGALSDQDNRGRNAILGALGGGALGAAGRRILRRVGGAAGERAAAGQLGAKEGEGRSTAGFLRRTGEKYMKVGKSSTLDTIQEQSRNTGSNVMEDVNIAAKKVLPIARNMTPAQWSAYDIYLGSDRSAGAQSLMRAAGVPAEIVDFAINTSDVSARKLQEVHAEAQSDPVRKKLFQDTFGSYETQPYLAFEDPKAWQQRGVEPALYEQIVRENVADPRFAGMSERAIRDDLDAYIQNIHNFGGDFAKYNQEKGQRISQSLFTPRKLLRPSIQKLLGKIENPLQRQILTVHKLAKGAATAKAVTEVQKPDAVDDRGNRLGMLQSEREAAMQAAQAAGDTERLNFLRSNYEEVPDGMRGLGSLAEGQPRDKVMVQRQVADALNIGQGHQVITMDKSILAMLNSIPKAAHTIWNLSTHVHNMIQAPMMGMIAGVDPISLVTQNRRVAVNPRRMQWARDDGIVNAHMGANEFGHGGEVFEHVLNPTFWQQTKGVAKKVQDFSKKIYGLPDQWVRMAKYNQEIDAAIKDGLTERAARARATELTNRYTQNYSNVAPAVKLLRNVPLVNSFISYTAEMVRVLKNRAEDFLTDPMAKKFGPSASQKWKGAAAIVATLGVGSAIAALIQGSKLSDEDKEKLSKLLPILPPYMRGKTQPVYSMKEGQVSSYNLNPLLPAEDLVTTAKNILNGDWEAFWKNNPVAGSDRSPVLNILAEQISGKDAMGRPTCGLLRNVAQNALPGWVPGNYAAEKLVQGFSRNDKGELGVTNEQGRHETPGTAIASLFGFNASHLDSRRLFQRQQQNLQEQDRAAKTILNRTLRSDAEAAAKEEAAAEYRETRRRIFQR